MGIPLQNEHALSDAVGRFWIPSSEHPVNRTRSYARYAYYDPIANRSNYHLLVGHKAESLVLSPEHDAEAVVFYQRDDPSAKKKVTAIKEIVLAAGAVHSPQILQLSGIGPRAVLEAANISIKVDAPGVGNNFQDHPQVYLTCNCKSKSMARTSDPSSLRSHQRRMAQSRNTRQQRNLSCRSPGTIRRQQKRSTDTSSK